MNPAVKYFAARIGMFAAIFLVLLPTPLDPLLCAMIALLASFALSFVVFGKWRREMIDDVDHKASRRKAEKEKLRKELAGEDED